MKMPKTFFILLLASVMIFVLAACGPTANAPASGDGAPMSGADVSTSGADISSAEPSQTHAPGSASTEPTPEPEPEPGIQDLPGAWTPVRDTAPDGWEILSNYAEQEIMKGYDFYEGPENKQSTYSNKITSDSTDMANYHNSHGSFHFSFMITPSNDVEKLYDRRLDHLRRELVDYGTNWVCEREKVTTLDRRWQDRVSYLGL